MSILKWWSTNDLVIDFSCSTLKKPRIEGPKTKSKVRVMTYIEDDYDNIEHGWLSDKDEIDCPEAVVAHLSPLKNGEGVTSSVSNFWLLFTLTYYYWILTIIELKGSVGVKTEDSLKAIHLYRQPPSETAPQHQHTATGQLKAWTLKNLPKGCNVNETFKLIASPTYPQILGHSKMPFGIPDDNDLSGMQAIFNHVYKALKSYMISIGSNCPVFRVVHYYYHVYTYDLLALIIMFSFILVLLTYAIS